MPNLTDSKINNSNNDDYIEKTLELKKLFRLLDVSPDDEQSISDGDLTYYFFAFLNLEDEQREILKKIGFKEFTETIFYIDSNEINIDTKLQPLLPIYRDKQMKLWDDLINKLVEINQENVIFKPTSKQWKIISTWKGKLVQNDDEFKSFVLDLSLLFRESCKNNDGSYRISRNCQSQNFWQIIGCLKNYYYSHDTEQWSDDAHRQYVIQVRQSLEHLFSTIQSNSAIDFINAQFKLLDDCLNFLDTISGEL